MLEVKPLPKSFADRAKELGAVAIEIQFAGGSDEGHCMVFLRTETPTEFSGSLAGEIEDWAREAYDYCGAGDGNDYGDDITYDFERNVVEVSEWYTQRVDGGSQELELVIEGDGVDEGSQN